MPDTLTLAWHITRRNWMVYKKDFLANIAPTLSDPALYVVALGLGLGAYINNIEGRSYIQYIAPGMTVTTALFTSFFETSWGFYVRMTYEGIYKAMLTTPIGVREIIFGEFIWVSLKGALMAFGVAIVLAACGLMPNLAGLPLMIVVGIMVALPCGAMGLVATSYVRNINQFQTVYAFIISPLFFLSGIFFPASQMPAAIKLVGDLFPLNHGVVLAQSVFWNQNIAEAFLIHGSCLAVQSAVFCLWAYKKLLPKLQN